MKLSRKFTVALMIFLIYLQQIVTYIYLLMKINTLKKLQCKFQKLTFMGMASYLIHMTFMNPLKVLLHSCSTTLGAS
nr:hypothetical protein Iba_chr05fCG10940 [Ipomoea batatas]